MNVISFGTACVVKFMGCVNIGTAAELKTLLEEAATYVGATILGSLHHDFEPQGGTALAHAAVALSESHYMAKQFFGSCHSWPTKEEGAVVCGDLYTCGRIDSMAAVKFLKDRLGAQSVWLVKIDLDSQEVAVMEF